MNIEQDILSKVKRFHNLAASHQAYCYAAKDDKCAYCGGPGQSDDHIKPQALGGLRQYNLTKACKSCNNDKGSMTLVEFLLDPRCSRKRALRRKLYWKVS